MKRQTIFLTDESKIILLKHINKSPGIRYRELQRATGFANGVLAYHLNILEKSNYNQSTLTNIGDKWINEK
jgi:predicted transcriptional regulator